MDPSQEFEYFPVLPDRSNENDISNLLDPKWSSFKFAHSRQFRYDNFEIIRVQGRNSEDFRNILDLGELERLNINVDQGYFPVFIHHYDNLGVLRVLIHGGLKTSASSLSANSLKAAIYGATGLPLEYQKLCVYDHSNKLPGVTTYVALRFAFPDRFFRLEPGPIGTVRVLIFNPQEMLSRLGKAAGVIDPDEIVLHLEPSVTVQVLKELVALAFSSSPKDIYLKHGGNYLENAEATLDHLGIADGSVVRASRTCDIDGGLMRTDHSRRESSDDGISPPSFAETKSYQSIRTFWTGRSSIWQEFWSARSRATKDGPRNLMAITKFLTAIKERGLVPSSDKEIDWSGKGMHVEFETHEDVNLEIGKVVGWSGTAVVQKVACRRILLARKTIHCRRMRLEDALCEVEHLQKLKHPHIIQLIGTYLQGPEFSILLYPLAEWNLGDFFHTEDLEPDLKRDFLVCSMVCLLRAIHYVHRNTIRHMDIKPSNILVKRGPIGKVPLTHGLRILLADFDIARHTLENPADEHLIYSP